MRNSSRTDIKFGDISSGNCLTKKRSICGGNSHSTPHIPSSGSCKKSRRIAERAARIGISLRSFVIDVSPFLLPLFLCCMPSQQCSAAVNPTSECGHCCAAADFRHPTRHSLVLLAAPASEASSEDAAAAVTVEARCRSENKGTVAGAAHYSRATAAFKPTATAVAPGSTRISPSPPAAHAPGTAAALASTTAVTACEAELTAAVLSDTTASAARITAAAAHQQVAERRVSVSAGDSKGEAAVFVARTTFSFASEVLGAFLRAAAAWPLVAAVATWPASAAALFAGGKGARGREAAQRLAAAHSAAEGSWLLQGVSAAAPHVATAAAASTASVGLGYPRYSSNYPSFLNSLLSSSSLRDSLPGRRRSASTSLAAAGSNGDAPGVDAALHASTRHAGAAAVATSPVKYDDESSSLPLNPRVASSVNLSACGVPPPSASVSYTDFSWCNTSAAASPSPAAGVVRAAALPVGAFPGAALRASASLRTSVTQEATLRNAAALPGTFSFSRFATPLVWQRLRRQAATQQWNSSARRKPSESQLPSLLATVTTAARQVGENSSSRSAFVDGRSNSSSRRARRSGTPVKKGNPGAVVTQQLSPATVEAKTEAAATAEEPSLDQVLLTTSSSREQRGLQVAEPQKEGAQQQQGQEQQQQRQLGQQEREQQQRQEQQQEETEEEDKKEEIIGTPLVGIMAWRCTGRTNDELVDRLRDAGVITNPRIYEAMKAVDRGNFIDTCAYMDSPQPLGIGSATISAPHMHAAALEELADVLQPGKRVLDVGSGSGYLTVVMAYIVGVKGIREEKAATSPQQEAEPEGMAVGIDYVPGLVKYSRDRVKKAYPRLLSNPHFQLLERDGWEGYTAAAPYDAIHVGAAAAAIPRRLLQQLKNGGKMVLPVEESLQGEILFEEDDEEGENGGKEEQVVMEGEGRRAADGGGRRRRSGGGGTEDSRGEKHSSTPSSVWSRLLMGSGGQRFVAVSKDEEGNVHVKKLMGVMYVPLVKSKDSLSGKNSK